MSSQPQPHAEHLRPDPPPRLRLFSLKDGDMFVVTDSVGDISGLGDGLFRNDTRILSYLQFRADGMKPVVLNTARSRDNVFLTAHLVNRPLGGHSETGNVHIERTKLLWNGTLYERVTCTNYGSADAEVPMMLRFAADFADIFEVRGTTRHRHGALQRRINGDDQVLLIYEGLDHVVRTTSVSFSEPPQQLTLDEAHFLVHLKPRGRHAIYIEYGIDRSARPDRDRYRAAAAAACKAMRENTRRGGRLKSSGLRFNDWIERSRNDLALLTTEMETGPFPYAGIPWFSTAFGRDSIITALQTLWLDPQLARGVLRFLARNQATETSSFQDSEPGKIMHETRKGEMTALNELPFGQYYGGVDTTPLFLMLVSAYAERTGDLTTVDALWPSVEAALGWIEQMQARFGNGLLSYQRGEKSGLANQGWKDSEDSIFHADGTMAQGPIALVEVQGYAYAAFRGMARLAERRGDRDTAAKWNERANTLRQTVESRFWSERLGTYGIALDGEGRLCEVRTSNPGHLLFSGLPEFSRARKVTMGFLTPAFDSGWGIRTLASTEANFNPMSYHNGSVWPHDTGLCVAGMARYGERAACVRLLNQMFEAAGHFGMQLPELFCGFARRPGEPPVHYPVACLPQAWAAGAPFMLLQACLGVQVDGWAKAVTVERPWLPPHVNKLSVSNIAVGDQVITLKFERLADHVVVSSDAALHHDVPVMLRL
ncbi:amylo-alpha-1,6-glucosidase [Rhizomicrobium electricum]|uniref:Amylo-alpha-1,6-glucosidase n=1 Tax=Rhizomicrobium electricum TaxID=480070 RepID=A0ABP3Q2N2_9PROT|nr:amylo-alpha-1,6-glucosidase [Rhizomicrobium electricum]NIJ49865.1 glycogen debranching enzyme [Rhizomicrobium electricum]